MGLFSSIGGLVGAGIGSMFGPVGTVVGGMIGGSGGSAIDANRVNKKQEGYFNQQMDFAKSQDQFQRDYVHNAMQWRIEDAKQAGVHPMAALGFQSPNYSPVSTPSAPSYMDSSNFDTGSTFGQTVNNAVFAAKTQQQQLQAGQLSNRGLELQNQHMELTNMQLASDLQRASMTTKAKPDVNGQGALGVIGGQQDAIPRDEYGNFLDKPIVRDGWLLDEKGRKLGIVPSEAAAQRFEDKSIVEWLPFMGSTVRAFKGRFLGQEVNGHWWHGEDKGFLPYPPKKEKGFVGHSFDAMRFYSDYGD